MAKDVERYGAELGAGIKRGLQGLNTVCSPKKRKTCILLLIIPLIISFVSIIILGSTASTSGDISDGCIAVYALSSLSLGLYQFYIGKFKKGILYAITVGLFYIGAIFDLFRLIVTKTLKDANGFPIIY